MGLDISYYRQIAPDANASEDDWETRVELYPNPAFPMQADGLSQGWYAYGTSDGFRAGSYSGYNDWREWLATLAGYPEDPDADDRHRHSDGASLLAEGPFHELICFSDCEGVIGPKTSAKLAKDFAEFDDRARAADEEDGWNYNLYCRWREAFEAASDNGAVDFH
jgi:hypothetical protein